MISQSLKRLALGIALILTVSAAAFAQYGGMGGVAPTSGGVYTPPKGGYSSSTGIAIGAGAAAAGVLAYFLLRNRGSMVGCVEKPGDGTSLLNEKDNQTYTLDAGDLNLKVGERVKLSGKKLKSSSGQPAFEAKKLVKDYGSCKQQAALAPSSE